MYKFYFDLIKDCKTLNQVNQVQIALSQSMTPLELVEFSKELLETDEHWECFELGHSALNISDVMLNAKKWISSAKLFADLQEGKIAQSFVRRILTPSTLHYSNGDSRTGKTLLICFCGNAQTMMIPTPSFLQHISAAVADVVLLQDMTRDGFRAGLDEFGQSLFEVIKKLPSLLNIDTYRRFTIMGASAGGLPAIVAGLHLQPDVCVSIGANNPDDPRWIVDGRNLARDMLSYKNYSRANTEFVYAYGQEAQIDEIAAKELAQIVPGKIIAIADSRGPVKHAALGPLAEKKQLKSFLTQILKFQS